VTTQEMKDMGLISVPLTADEVFVAILALHEAEEAYLRRAARYMDAGWPASYADAVKRAGAAQKLAAWIAHHANQEL
jgi:hypothetical protein